MNYHNARRMIEATCPDPDIIADIHKVTDTWKEDTLLQQEVQSVLAHLKAREERGRAGDLGLWLRGFLWGAGCVGSLWYLISRIGT